MSDAGTDIEVMRKWKEYRLWHAEQEKFLAARFRKLGDLSDSRLEARAYYRCAQALEDLFIELPSKQGG